MCDDDMREYLEEMPDPEVMIEWDVEDWVTYFDRHDCRRNTFLGRMRGREETETEFAAALRESNEDSKRDRIRLRKLGKRILEEFRQDEEAVEEDPWTDAGLLNEDCDTAEVWRASLPELPLAFRNPEACNPWSDWDEIVAECPAFGDAMSLIKELGPLLPDVSSQGPTLAFAVSSISTTIIGVSMGHGYWCQREDFPLAKTARYFLSARRFEQVARILERLDTPEFRAFAPRAKSIATGFRTTAEASAGRSRHRSLGTS